MNRVITLALLLALVANIGTFLNLLATRRPTATVWSATAGGVYARSPCQLPGANHALDESCVRRRDALALLGTGHVKEARQLLLCGAVGKTCKLETVTERRM